MLCYYVVDLSFHYAATHVLLGTYIDGTRPSRMPHLHVHITPGPTRANVVGPTVHV